MSSSKLDSSGIFNPVAIDSSQTHLRLPTESICIRKNGIEFHSPSAFPIWTEMTVELQSPNTAKKVKCTGVIVACKGNRHAGFRVSILFINLTSQAELQLEHLALSQQFSAR